MMNNKMISLSLPPGREPGLFVGLDLGQPATVGRTLVTGAVFLPDEAPRQQLGSKWDRRDMVRQCAWRKDGWLVTDRLPRSISDLGGGSFTITAIPEPSTYAAAAGLLAMFLCSGRRRLIRGKMSMRGCLPTLATASEACRKA